MSYLRHSAFMASRLRFIHFKFGCLSSAMATRAAGGGKDKRRKTLIFIGGHEDREGPLIDEYARYAANGKLDIATIAAEDSTKIFDSYRRAFSRAGIPEPEELAIDSREEALDAKSIEILEGATGVFFTGGDQLRIT